MHGHDPDYICTVRQWRRFRRFAGLDQQPYVVDKKGRIALSVRRLADEISGEHCELPNIRQLTAGQRIAVGCSTNPLAHGAAAIKDVARHDAPRVGLVAQRLPQRVDVLEHRLRTRGQLAHDRFVACCAGERPVLRVGQLDQRGEVIRREGMLGQRECAQQADTVDRPGQGAHRQHVFDLGIVEQRPAAVNRDAVRFKYAHHPGNLAMRAAQHRVVGEPRPA